MTKMKHNCDWCGKEFEIAPFRLKAKTICCSRECASKLRIENNKNCVCPVCGKKFYADPYHIEEVKHGVCCSKKCSGINRKTWFSGELNHQYGLKGDKNGTWKSDRRISSWGYVLIRCLDHPFRNSDDFVFEHRLIAEKYLLTDENSVEIDGKRYLKNDYVVHHIDHNRTNNDLSNLVVMTKEEHTRFHAEEKRWNSEMKARTCAKCGDSFFRLNKRWGRLCEDCYEEKMAENATKRRHHSND